jgi:outer membrane protein TolC
MVHFHYIRAVFTILFLFGFTHQSNTQPLPASAPGVGVDSKKNAPAFERFGDADTETTDADSEGVPDSPTKQIDSSATPSSQPSVNSSWGNSAWTGVKARLRFSLSLDTSAGPEPFKNLSVEEAIEGLLKNNPDIIKARLEWLASHSKFIAAFGDFEPALVGSYKFEATDRAAVMLEQTQNSYSGGIEGLLPTATKYNLALSVNNIDHRFSDNANKPSAFAGLTIVQPLLQGLWFGKPVIDIKSAKVGREIAFHKYRSTLFEKIYELENAYWKLCYMQEKLNFAAQSVAIAQEIVEDGKLQVKAGKISPLEAVEASAGLAARLSNFADARKELISAANDLKILIAGRSFLNDSIIQPSTSLHMTQHDSAEDLGPEPKFDDIAAIQPDYLQKKYELDKERLACDYQTNQCLPEVNFKGSYGYLVTGSSSDVMWRNFSDPLYRSRCPTYSAEIELRIPLGMNVKERNLLTAEKRTLQAAESMLFSTKIQIENYLSVTRKRIHDLRRNLGNATIVVEYRKTLLAAEIKRQKAGKSTFRKIFEIEEELTKSLEWEMENILDYRSSKVGKARLTGRILLDKKLEAIDNGKPVLAPRLTRESARRP